MKAKAVTLPKVDRLELLHGTAGLGWFSTAKADTLIWCQRCNQSFRAADVGVYHGSGKHLLLQCPNGRCAGNPLDWDWSPWWRSWPGAGPTWAWTAVTKSLGRFLAGVLGCIGCLVAYFRRPVRRQVARSLRNSESWAGSTSNTGTEAINGRELAFQSKSHPSHPELQP